MAETPAKSQAGPVNNIKNDYEFLVKQFQQGDDTAFDSIVQQYYGDIASLANRMLGWSSDVEDIVQQVFLAAYLKLKKFRGQSNLKTWLFAITINKCRNYRYRQILQLRFLSKKTRDKNYHDGADKSQIDYELFERVRNAVEILPVKYREAVVLRYLQELTTEETCSVLRISNSALQTRLSRARRLLKDRLAGLTKD